MNREIKDQQSKTPEEEEWESARVSRPFQLLFQLLEKWEADLKEAWANGEFTGDSFDKTIQLNSQAIGQLHVLKRLREIDYETIESELSDDN